MRPLLYALGSAALLPATALAANLVQNSSFEQSYADWQFTGSSGIHGQDGQDPTHSGDWMAYINLFSPGEGTISQPIPTVPGQTYDVGVWIANNGGQGTVSLGFGATGVPLVNPGGFYGYLHYGFTATATDSNTLFSIFVHPYPGTIFFDDVSIEPHQIHWNVNHSGDWNDASNWDGPIPQGADAVVSFGNVLTSARTVFTDVPLDVGTLNFDSPFTYVISGAGSLNLAASDGQGGVNVISGSHKIALPVNITNNATLSVGAGANLALTNPVTIASGVTVNKNGDGILDIITTINANGPATLKLNGGTTNIELNGGSNLTIAVDPSTVNFGANQTLSQIAIIGGSIVNVGRNGFGTDVDATLSTGGLVVSGGGVNTLNTTHIGNLVTVGSFSIDGSSTLVKSGAGTLVVNGLQSHQVGSQLLIAGGKVIFNTDTGGNLGLSFSGDGSLVFNSGQQVGSVNVGDGTTAVIAHSASGAPIRVVGALALNNTGKLDLTDNDLILNAGSATLSSINDLVRNGRMFTSAGTQYTGLAAVLNDFGLATFDSQPVTANSILIKYTYFGDANLDGIVNADDYALLDRGFAKHLATWQDGDFNYDGSITAADYALADHSFILQGAPLSPEFLAQRESQFGPQYVSALIASLPEPSAILTFILVVPMLLRCRRQAARCWTT